MKNVQCTVSEKYIYLLRDNNLSHLPKGLHYEQVQLSQLHFFFWILTSPMERVQTQEQRGVANGISVTPMSIFKAVALVAAGIL